MDLNSIKTSPLYFGFENINVDVKWTSAEHLPMIELLKMDFNSFQIANNINTSFDHVTIEINLNSDFIQLDSPIYSFKIKLSDKTHVYEIIRNYVLAIVGLHWETKGWMRFHALGIEKNNKNLVFCLPSKGGKSSLATEHLSNELGKIFSDEIVFTNGKTIRAFPICIALSQKAAEDLKVDIKNMSAFKKRKYEVKYLTPISLNKVAAEGPVHKIYAINTNLIKFIWSSFWGLGLPQMAQYILRIDNLHRLLLMAFTRAKVLTRLFLNGKIQFIRFDQKPLKIMNVWNRLQE
jgi:hypothetical protein